MTTWTVSPDTRTSRTGVSFAYMPTAPTHMPTDQQGLQVLYTTTMPLGVPYSRQLGALPLATTKE